MDLAKIRKKSLQAAEEPHDSRPSAPVSYPELVRAALPEASTDFFTTDAASLQRGSLPLAVSASTALPQFERTVTSNAAEARSPLEIILAGRAAAGCDDESLSADETIQEASPETGLEFLCFRVSDEIYGINIMDIKEIIKPREVTEVPRAPAFVSGVLSLRGTIIPIIDMRIRLGLARSEQTGKERIIVVKSGASFCGLLVDEVTKVVVVQKDAFEAAPTVLDGIDRDFINGIGRSDGHLIIILNLENIADINLY